MRASVTIITVNVILEALDTGRNREYTVDLKKMKALLFPANIIKHKKPWLSIKMICGSLID